MSEVGNEGLATGDDDAIRGESVSRPGQGPHARSLTPYASAGAFGCSGQVGSAMGSRLWQMLALSFEMELSCRRYAITAVVAGSVQKRAT